MSLWVDKHRPRDLSKLDFHKEQAVRLKNLVQQSDFPHLLVYGPSGAGKKTRIMCLLRELYGPGVERLRQETMNFTTPSNKKIEIMTVSSNYHIEVNPTDVGIHDRVVIMDLVKNVAQTHQIDSSGQREFKVVILNEVDDLTKDAQHALRRTMEKYVATCRLILIANSISRVIPAIRSRCLTIRVPAPTETEISSVLHAVCKKEGLSLPPELAMRIAKCADRNLRRALLMCEACKVQKYPFTADQKVPEPDWQQFIRDTASMILSEQTPKKLGEVRQKLYELLIHGVPPDMIFSGLLHELVRNCDMAMKCQVASHAASYEHRMRLGNKPIFHLEAFVAKFMAIYKKFMEESMGDAF
ncbi:replication factor C subunit 3 [Plutella xylostella]|uniref:replication factor C subunit 3 n=1 Tax=Plutella xylostella TaxID=51655 RepID=UPI002032CF92|nr:replication factor C subunit 3 [Plutella xylostella]